MKKIQYQLICSARKSIAIQLLPGGEVVVRAPKRMRSGDIEAFVQSKRDWLEAHLANQPQPKLREQELQTLMRHAREVLPQIAAAFAPLIGVTYGTITIRAQHTRWGSCTGEGNLNFNCLLMLTPDEVMEYVVVHELCHRKQMNHSTLFWAEVERVLPNYRESRRWLRENGSALIARLN